MNKIFSFGTILALVSVPAIAEPSHSSNSFPSNGVMAEDYTYVGQANVTNLKVSSGTATTNATYADCPSGYPNSDDGATSTDQCYTACTVSDFPANSHIATVIGKNYQGANETDTCAIESCDTGYTLNPGSPDLNAIFGEDHFSNTSGTGKEEGSFTRSVSGIGTLHGIARCSAQSGDGGTSPTLSDSSGSNCWCQINGYTPDGGSLQSVVSHWKHVSGGRSVMSGCSNYCGEDCQQQIVNASFRVSLLNTIDTSPSCQANIIAITWADADQSDVDANDAGSVTYGGDIRTPKKAVHKAGKVFTGWTFNTPNQ